MRLNLDQVKPLIKSTADELGLDPNLIYAICMTESGLDPFATRFERNWKYSFRIDIYSKKNHITMDTERVCQSMSWGLMQVMGTVARELGFEGNLIELSVPRLGLHYGAKKLKQLTVKHQLLEDIIASYNAGSPIKNFKTGQYFNQEYVDKVKYFLKLGVMNEGANGPLLK